MRGHTVRTGYNLSPLPPPSNSLSLSRSLAPPPNVHEIGGQKRTRLYTTVIERSGLHCCANVELCLQFIFTIIGFRVAIHCDYLSPSVPAPPPLGDQKPDAWIISLIFLEAGKKSRSLVHLLIERDVSNHTSCPSSSIPLATLHTFLPSSFFPARCYTCAPDFGLALRGVARRCVAWHGNSNAIFFLLCATTTTLFFFFFFYFKTPSYEFVNLLLPLLRIHCMQYCARLQR